MTRMAMSEQRRSRRMRSLWVAGPVAAAVAAGVVLGGTAAAASSQVRPAQLAVSVRAPEGAIARGPALASNVAGTAAADGGARTAAAAPASAGTAGASAQASSGLAARAGEGQRSNGVLGQWVVVVLLGILMALWVTLIAVVVRVRLRFARTAGSDPTMT